MLHKHSTASLTPFGGLLERFLRRETEVDSRKECWKEWTEGKTLR